MTDIEFRDLSRAITKGQIELVETMICSPDVANATNRFGWTPLMLAAAKGITKIGQILLDRGANIHALNDSGENALSLAALTGHLRFVELLIAHGANSDVRPHGHSLDQWVSQYSGLADAKINAILDAIPPPPPQER